MTLGVHLEFAIAMSTSLDDEIAICSKIGHRDFLLAIVYSGATTFMNLQNQYLSTIDYGSPPLATRFINIDLVIIS